MSRVEPIMTKMIALTVFVVLSASTDALAQALPARSIEQFCSKIAKTSGAPKDDVFGVCVDAERASLAELKENWNDYTPQSRARCLRTAGGEGLYSDLEACIEAAEAMRASESR